MALPTTCLFEIRNGGSDTLNGGTFDPGATFAADLAATVATGTAPVVTSATYTFVAGDVGAFLFIKSGTNWTPGWYPIASVSAGAATLSAAIGGVTLYNGTTLLNAAAGCATTASPTAGTWGVDYSQQSAAQFAFTDMAIDATTNTKFTSAAHPVGPNFVGNSITVNSGTGWTVQRSSILSTTGTVATCHQALGTTSSTGGTGGMGGGLASPGMIGTISAFTSYTAFIKYNATPYACTATANGAGGKLAPSAGLVLVGYDTTRAVMNNDTNRPTINAAAASMTLFDGTGSASQVHNLIFDNSGSNATVTLVKVSGSYPVVRRCRFRRATTIALSITSGICKVSDCEFSACSGTSVVAATCSLLLNRATLDSCSATSAIVFTGGSSGASQATDVVVSNFTGTGNIFSVSGAQSVAFSRCTGHIAAGSTGSGISYAGTTEMTDCLMVGGNAGGGGIFGFVNNAATGPCRLANCAAWNFSGGNYSVGGGQSVESFVSLSASPFTSVGGNDFSLNSTAGGGAACKGTGTPTAYPGLTTTTSTTDIGAVQSGGGSAGGLRYIHFDGGF